MILGGMFAVAANAQDSGAPVAKPKAEVKAAAVPSSCKGLDAKTCGGNAACKWIVPTKVNAKTGKVANAYCRKAPKLPVCKGLNEKACGIKPECAWSVPKKVSSKTGKIPEAACRKASKSSKK